VCHSRATTAKPILARERYYSTMSADIKFNKNGEYSMANKNKSVFGIYSSRSAVENAVSALKWV
jgi:hypothetical protein